MPRPVTLFTGQWADLPLETMCAKAASFDYDGIELACWGDHFNVQEALRDDAYIQRKWETLGRHGLSCYAISNHLVGQAVCDRIDERHQAIVPAHVWGDGEAEGVRRRAAQEMMDTARAARRFFDAAPTAVREHLARTGRTVANGFTGSSIWHLLYAFPPVGEPMIEAGFSEFAQRWGAILDAFDEQDVDFGFEVHPTEIAFDIASARRAVDAVGGHRRFCFNYDPSHLAYQGVDALKFIYDFGERIVHAHVKDVWWSDQPADVGVFGGHTAFGSPGRYWDFRSPGRGRVDFESMVRALNHIGYDGPLSVEWEDPMMDREHGATEAASFVRGLDFARTGQAFDAAFSE